VAPRVGLGARETYQIKARLEDISRPIRFDPHRVAVLARADCPGGPVFFAVVRSWLVLDFIGLLIWPVLLGFGIDRLCAGEGIWGGTGAGALGFAGMALAVPGGLLVRSSGALNPIGFLSTLVVGAIWGFYLSIWTYMIVETIIYYCY
jgi:hypothetical protein